MINKDAKDFATALDDADLARNILIEHGNSRSRWHGPHVATRIPAASTRKAISYESANKCDMEHCNCD
jgi:hypothetical protein